MVNTALAGGALLGLGVYPLTWIFQILYHLQPGAHKEVPSISAAVERYTTGVDEMTSIICHFPAQKAMGIALTALRVGSATDDTNPSDPSIRIQGSGGEIQIFGPAYKPSSFKVIENGAAQESNLVECPIPQDNQQQWGNGTFWEADECARCIRDKRLESTTMPWNETIVIMEVIESVLRQGGVNYPDLITSTHFTASHAFNTGRAG